MTTRGEHGPETGEVTHELVEPFTGLPASFSGVCRCGQDDCPLGGEK